jgi:hypothetical protein
MLTLILSGLDATADLKKFEGIYSLNAECANGKPAKAIDRQNEQMTFWKNGTWALSFSAKDCQEVLTGDFEQTSSDTIRYKQTGGCGTCTRAGQTDWMTQTFQFNQKSLDPDSSAPDRSKVAVVATEFKGEVSVQALLHQVSECGEPIVEYFKNPNRQFIANVKFAFGFCGGTGTGAQEGLYLIDDLGIKTIDEFTYAFH